MPPKPCPLPYLHAVVEHLRSEEPAVWRWFASAPKREEEAAAVRLDLLKSTYRLEAAAQPKLYQSLNEIRDRMQLDCTLTLYQAQGGNNLNAALAYLPGEAHIILAGPLAEVLLQTEIEAVLAHELAHFLLFEDSQNEYLIAQDLLRALANDPSMGAASAESLRLYNLWTEIFADRWACYVSADMMATIAALIKTATGLSEVSVESYLRQADEIFARSNVQTENLTHPETFIRARAIRLWSERGDDAHPEIERMMEGGLNLNRLDLLGQKRGAHLTRRFLQTLLQPAWHQTETVLAHARHFFADFKADAHTQDHAILKREIEQADSTLVDYFCYLMLDFITVDRDLGDVALASAIVQSQLLGIEKRFSEIVQKELTLGKKVFARIVKEAESTLAKTQAAHSS